MSVSIIPDSGSDCGALELAEREQQAFEKGAQRLLRLRGDILTSSQFSRTSSSCSCPERCEVEQLERVSRGGENSRLVSGSRSEQKPQVVRKRIAQCVLQHIVHEQRLEDLCDDGTAIADGTCKFSTVNLFVHFLLVEKYCSMSTIHFTIYMYM